MQLGLVYASHLLNQILIDMESKLPSTLVVCALLTSNLNAQNSGTLNINDVEMRVYSNGDIGRAQGDTQPGFVAVSYTHLTLPTSDLV